MTIVYHEAPVEARSEMRAQRERDDFGRLKKERSPHCLLSHTEILNLVYENIACPPFLSRDIHCARGLG